MCLDLSCQQIMRSQDPKFAVRQQMAPSALSQGIRPTRCAFPCSRNTVRPWLRRYQEQGLAGLQERSRAPHHIPRKTTPELEQQVVEAGDAIPCFGLRRLKRYFDLPCSSGAIARILKQAGRRRRRKKPRLLGLPSSALRAGSGSVRVGPAALDLLKWRRGQAALRLPAKRGPKTRYTDGQLRAEIRRTIQHSPFLGEGRRKAWARLRLRRVRILMRRVLPLMRGHHLP